MKKGLLILLLLLFIPFNVFGISKDYKDVVSDITNTKIETNKINIYLFHRADCPHCRSEIEWLKEIDKKYNEYINIYYFEIINDVNNAKMLQEVKQVLESTENSVPFTVIGEEYFIGFSDAISSRIESTIKNYIDIENNSSNVKLPILGTVNMKEVSIPLVAIILGFIDGFNPCALWILLFLINMLFSMKNKRKSWILGLTFLIVSGVVYFLSMLGMNFVIGITAVKWIKVLIGIFILTAGIFNFRKYLITRKKDAGCTVVDEKKRKKLMKKMKKIISSKSFMFSLVGIIILAVSVNLIELACSLGFPLIFTEILDLNSVKGITKIVYLLLYILFYMLDDIIIFSISMITVEATGITNKYNKLCTLVSSIIMIIIGILLLIKPEWLMFNF